MKFYDVVSTRRTIRDFTESPIGMDVVKRILLAGLKAPTNDHMRNWEFVVITDKRKIASIWCCIENILLAATSEGLGACIRIPLGNEPEHILKVLNHPKEYIMPCYIALGHPSPKASVIKQKECNIEDKLHINNW